LAGTNHREEIEVPEKAEWKLSGQTLKLKGPKGEVERAFAHPVVRLSSEKGKLVLSATAARRRDMALVGTWRAHIENMGHGVTEGHTYTMKVVFSHFPIKTTVKGSQFVIENFLGEQFPRTSRIEGATKVKVEGDKVTLTGPDVEAVSLTAANIEQSTRIRGYDPRVFQDGIYIVTKGE
jgi:large subunit ribosomal protein L6